MSFDWLLTPHDDPPRDGGGLRDPVVLAALAVALLVRVVGLTVYSYHDVDMGGILALAGDLTEGRGLAATDLAYWPPVTSVLTAALAALGPKVQTAGHAVVVAAGTIAVLPAAWLGRELGGRGAMRWSALGAALLPQLAVATQRVHAEPLAGLALLMAAVLLVRSQRSRNAILDAAGAGAFAALAYLARFEMLVAAPLILAALAVTTRHHGRTQRVIVIATALASFTAVALPYWLVIHSLGQGFGPIPAARLNANLSFTLTGNVLSYGQPGAEQVATAHGGIHGGDTPLEGAWTTRGQLIWHVLANAASTKPFRAMLRMVSPLVLGLVGFVLLRPPPRTERRQLTGLLLLLGLPATTSLLIVDAETRYWYSWALLALPMAGAGMARLMRDHRAWLARWGPLLCVGLLSLPQRRHPISGAPLVGPGELPLEALLALVEGKQSLSVMAAAPGGWLPSVSTLAAMALLAGVTIAWHRRLGLRWTTPLMAVALGISVLSLHFTHLRSSLPSCHFSENLPLAGLAASCSLAAASSLDAHVLTAGASYFDDTPNGTWIPAPRPELSRDAQLAYWEATKPDMLLLDLGDPRALPIHSLVDYLGFEPSGKLSPPIAVARGDIEMERPLRGHPSLPDWQARAPVMDLPGEPSPWDQGDPGVAIPHLLLYTVTAEGKRCRTRWELSRPEQDAD